MLNLFDQTSKAVQEQWPKALAGLVIPACQIAWKTWKDRQTNTRTSALRLQITQLAQFLQTPLGESPAAITIRQNTQQQYDAALNELAELSHAPQNKPADKLQDSRHGPIRTIFLLYTPRSLKGWGVHSLFYMLLILLVVSSLGTLYVALIGDASINLGDALIGIGFYAVLTFLVWRWAIRISNPARALEHKPRWGWIPRILIWISACFEILVAIGFSLNNYDELSMAVFRANFGPFAFVSAVSAVVIIPNVFWLRHMKKKINSSMKPESPLETGDNETNKDSKALSSKAIA